MSLFDAASANPAGFRELPVTGLPQPLPADVRLIDVREPHEYASELGHIANAALVPLATVPAQAAAWDKSKIYVMVCRSGGRSAQAAQALVRMGFGQVINLAGGMLAWSQAGLATER